MFLIDLNQSYFKVVNGGQVWAHDLDDLQWLVPDDDPVHVRKGKEVALMPLSAVHQWLFPFGPFDINSDAFPEEYIDSVVKRRESLCFDDWEDRDNWHPSDDSPDCGCESCDGTCETCTFPQLGLRQIAFMKTHMKSSPQPLDDDFGPDDIPF